MGLLLWRGLEPLGAGLARHRLQLLDGGRAVDVGRDREHLLLALFDQVLGQLGGGGGLAGALQAGHQDHRRRLRGEVQFGHRLERAVLVGLAHRGGELAVHDAHQRLARRQRADHVLAQRLVLDAGDEVAHHRQRHVGLEQRHAHLAQHVLHVAFGNAGFAAHRLHEARQAVGQGGGHRRGGARGGGTAKVHCRDDSIVRIRRLRRAPGWWRWPPWPPMCWRRSRAAPMAAGCRRRWSSAWCCMRCCWCWTSAAWAATAAARASVSARWCR